MTLCQPQVSFALSLLHCLRGVDVRRRLRPLVAAGNPGLQASSFPLTGGAKLRHSRVLGQHY